MTCSYRFASACVAFALTAAAPLSIAPAQAARVGVLSNRFSAETAADFAAHIPAHTFTAVDVSSSVPTLDSLLASYDEILLFEDKEFDNAPLVGNVVASYALAGHSVVLGTFYDQDRSDVSGPLLSPHSWGMLEQIDPNTTDGQGTPYQPRTLNTTTMVAHPLTAGLTSLTSTQYAGGNQAKIGTIVVANWNEPNVRGLLDPAIAYRLTQAACVIHVAIAPDYPSVGTYGVDFGGDFYLAWQNAFDFAAGDCRPRKPDEGGGNVTSVPTLSEWALALTALLVLAVAFAQRRRLRRR